MINLRDYQQQVIDDTRAAMRRHRRVLIQAPTGAGKTVLASYMMQAILEKGGTGYFICHRRELVDQTAMTFDAAGIPYGYIAAGYPKTPEAGIQICSIDTLKNRLDDNSHPRVCIWDEAHHLGAEGWRRVHDHYSKAWHVGLSATPERLDGKGLEGQFDVIVKGPPIEDLIEQGYLAQYKIFSIPGVDMTGVKSKMGEYVPGQAAAAMDRPIIMGNIVGHWQKRAADKLTIAFGVTIKHSRSICAAFQSHGIMALHLDGRTPKDERRQALRAFARGDVRVISNVGLFGEGFDAAANSGMDVTVGCVIDAAPTQSLGRWLQRCGRALRPQRSPAIILDHCGNALRHGLPCEPREWSLKGCEKTEDDGDKETLRQCEVCFYCHPPAPECPMCGYVYPVQERHVAQVSGELEEIDLDAVRKARNREQAGAQSIEALIELGKKRGYKYPAKWAAHVWTARKRKRRSKRYA